MPRRLVLPLSLALAVAGAVQAQSRSGTAPPPTKKVYCWDEGGRRVCGDALPAEASGKARIEISARSGLTTGRVDRALTEDERSAAAAAAEAARKQAEVEAAAARRDLAMVDAYVTEADLRRAYGERTSLLDESLKTADLSVANLRQSLLSLLRQAGDLELQAKPVPKRLSQTIAQQHADLLRQQQIIAAQRADRTQLQVELEDAVVRYRKLKGEDVAQPPAAATGTAPPSRG